MKAIISQLLAGIAFCLLCSTGTSLYAQDSLAAGQVPLVVRLPDPDKLEAMRADKDFLYHEVVQQDDSFWKQLRHKIGRWLEETFYKGRASGFWEFLIYVLLTVIVVFVFVKMQKVGLSELISRKAAPAPLPYHVVEENIHELALDVLIEEAIRKQELRKAIRLHYLQSLKKLTDAHLIHWLPGKTNRSYIAEIQHPALRREFEQLTSMFEYVWYGGAGLGTELFDTARNEFMQFDNLIKQHA
ncbi:DUF4129 domain-containing protein [Pontibacter beigongshangensis]|uniref:DUF4129 domain-containing protein n=1 Tax=Pontibacter beigongshangensis TaxID=2574733 RepID=UPI00165096E1|nr:DUF4129 domain-containing protein [Pontibacter beigongshangensis]